MGIGEICGDEKEEIEEQYYFWFRIKPLTLFSLSFNEKREKVRERERERRGGCHIQRRTLGERNFALISSPFRIAFRDLESSISKGDFFVFFLGCVFYDEITFRFSACETNPYPFSNSIRSISLKSLVD